MIVLWTIPCPGGDKELALEYVSTHCFPSQKSCFKKKNKNKKINQIVYLMPVNLHSGTTSGQLKVQRPELWRTWVYDSAVTLPFQS